MDELNFFNSVENLEPKCPGCKIKVEFDISTQYNEKLETQVCKCGHAFE